MKPKVILYMATSINGMIAGNNDDTGWISKEVWGKYIQNVRAAGNIIIGHRTYDILTKEEISEFEKIKLVVVATSDFQTLSPNHQVAHSPKEALNLLKDFKTVIVAGGAMLNASFFANNLIDEVFLDVEPIIFGAGIPLFRNKSFKRHLKLVGQKMITENEIQLHYKVL